MNLGFSWLQMAQLIGQLTNFNQMARNSAPTTRFFLWLIALDLPLTRLASVTIPIASRVLLIATRELATS